MPARMRLLAIGPALILAGCLQWPGGAAAQPPAEPLPVPVAAAPGPPGAPIAPAAPPAVLVGDFAAAAWASWENVTYLPWSPKVDYRREQGPAGEAVARAVSRDAGSMFLRRIDFDPRTYPVVRWRWKVPGPMPGANERQSDRDDAAARVYFVWGLRDKGDLFRGAEALGYIWGKARRAGEIGASPFSDRIGIVCLRSGAAGANAWQDERRDLAADYKAYFKRAPSAPVTAIAILTDTDHTDGEATAWYGPIFAEGVSARITRP